LSFAKVIVTKIIT